MRISRPRAVGPWLALALVLGLGSNAFAQTGAASITGLLTDQSGAAAPGVTVTAINQATNVAYPAVSNSAGNYTITSVPVGTYVVKAELSGFKTATTKPFPLEAKQIARLDLKMEVGRLEDNVEVTAEAPVLQTESATVGEVISGNTVNSLPLNGRNTGQLALLLPGVVTPNPQSFVNQSRNFSGGRPYVNGNREQTNNYLIDGVDMNESIDNLVAYQPSPDALSEISVETNNYAADTGNVAGAVLSNVIKSGSNAFHGNAFEFFRDSSLDANTWANNRSGAPRQKRRQNIFGATLGGPVIKNKLFFFADYQGTRYNAPGTEVLSVAPAAWRTGDFSSVTTVIRDPLTGQPFPGNIIPANRISPVARAILSNPSLYPLPNRTVSGGVAGNFVGPTSTTTRAHQGDARLDWNASTNDKFFARFSYSTYDSKNDTRAFPLLLGNHQSGPFKNLAVNWNRVFSPSVVNEVLLGYNEIAVVSETLDWNGIGNANANFGIPGGQPIPGLSSLVLNSGLTSIGAGASDSDTLDKTYQFNEKLTLLKGRHSLKVGGQLLHYNQKRFYAGNNGLLGNFNYGGTFSGFGFSDFLLDQVSAKGRGSNSDAWTHVHNRMALFVQDDFKATRDLTVNVGLRWAYTQPLTEKDNRESNFSLLDGHQIIATDGSIEDRALYKPYYKGFEPRLGFAWRKGERWVFRGGYGISQYMEGTGANLRLPLNPPYFFESNVNYDRTTGPGSTAAGFTGLVPLDKPSGQVRAFDPELRPQFTQQWNVFAEFLLTGSMSVNVGYVGHHATHLVTPVEGNQPLAGTGDPATWAPLQNRRPLFATAPLITNISTTASRGRSNYNALQASIRKRPTHGLEYLASYTFGKILTNNLGYYGSSFTASEGAYWMNAYRSDWNYGPAFFDVKHNFVFSAAYELPFGKGRKWGSNWSGLGNAILGGWKLSGIVQARSGIPITVQDSRGSSLQAVRGGERPNCVGDPVPSNQSIDNWIDINAFARAPQGTWGDCGIGVVRAPGYRNIDAVLSKRFDVGGSRYIEFRAEAFNLTNTPSFAPPGRNIADVTTFGKVTTTTSLPRNVELVAKLFF
jgi:hypothetical protein